MHVRAHGISRTYGAGTVLSGIEVDVGPGSCLAITGPSGSGKSTLLHVLAGMAAPDAGTVFWDEVDLYRLGGTARNRLFQRRVGWLAQAPLLDPDLDVLGNCLLPAAFHRLPEARAQASDLLAQVDLGAASDQTAASLSGGQQVRCALARTLLSRPDLLIADEPTGSLDADTAHQVATVLLRLCREHRCTLVLATHDLELAGRCERHLQLEGQAGHAPATPVA
ncbi:MAG: ABC transporter ATP-binding protein [Planctomycetota bacterium]